VSDAAGLEAFLDKWRARWPEWRVAETFVPAPDRRATLAWLALRQELADAAWEGADPRPGMAKLAWWGEELGGWAAGRRRHPLGLALQRAPAPWNALAQALPALALAREAALPADPSFEALHEVLAPFATAAAGVSTVLAAGTPASAMPAPGTAIAASLSAMRVLAGEGSVDAARELLGAWPARPGGTRADRIFAALARLRLQALRADGGDRLRVASHWQALWVAWRAGRSVPRA
jgi:hypothetical protein